MRIFVPKFRHNVPHLNRVILDSMLVQIDPSDLQEVIDFWHSLDKLSEHMTAREFFTTSVKQVCTHPYQEHTLSLFLRRPHITIHAGAKDPQENCRESVVQAAFDAGRLTARYGFNLWYGGGASGLMGTIIRGFNEEVSKNGRRPDQYSVQIVPSEFVYGVKTTNGLHPANEGLSDTTDAAIIMPDFSMRRELLDSQCIAAITCPGGIGSLDEWSDMVVHTKTGLRDRVLYTLNTYVPGLGRGYYDSLRQLVDDFVVCGLEGKTTLDHLHFVATPQDAFDHLLKELEKEKKLPDLLYADYCSINNVTPGVPARLRRKSDVEEE